MVGDGVAETGGARLRRARRYGGRDAMWRRFRPTTAPHAAVASRPYPGVADTLRALAAEGWRLAVCTNKPEAAARALLTALGLARCSRAVGGGDSFPVRKPDPAHLLATLRAGRRRTGTCGDGRATTATTWRRRVGPDCPASSPPGAMVRRRWRRVPRRWRGISRNWGRSRASCWRSIVLEGAII